jgi:hypothetical protein
MSESQGRRTRPRRALVVASAAAAVALAIGIPAVVSAVGGRGPARGAGGGDVQRGRTVARSVPDGWRVESWRDLTWAVPANWGYGTIDQWCADDDGVEGRGRLAPVVQRPYGVSTLVGCGPPRGLGIEISVGGAAPSVDADDYVGGAAVAQKRFGAVTVTVSTRDEALTDRVLGTVRRFEGLDPNGCPAAGDPVGVGEGDGVRGPAAGLLSVCRYARPDPERAPGWILDQSEQLSAVSSAQAWTALRAAPAGSGPDADPAECSGWEPEQVVALRTSAAEVAWVHVDGCSGRGVELLGDGAHRLTAEVLRWAFSPGWSGAVDGSLPLPDLPRELSR